MSSSTKSSLGDGKLPVFVSPTVLYFYSNDQSSHKQKLIVYNPYNYAVKFKVLCNAPQKYSVMNSEGTIGPQCRVDVFIRHQDISINHEGVKDKFRVHLIEVGLKRIIGTRDFIAVLLPSKRISSDSENQFHSLPPGHRRDAAVGSATNTRTDAANERQVPGMLIAVTAILCIIALMLPLEGDIVSKIPEYLHLTVNQKLIAAYILGLATVLILHL
ncbi:hypothetical protein CHS0354_020566 [Potamilus streckersoni]|uniref:MSP domain-containing protein n=1 Tax=Potamilus streckersoni TaxID=2493646 RepID=A0AAE0SN04_9BIVA|nr:hypothetical protein CHS0354_020566 [Potamilus streckersoni]